MIFLSDLALLLQIYGDLFEVRLTEDVDRDVLVLLEKLDEVLEQLLSQLQIDIAVDEDECQGFVEDRSKHVPVCRETAQEEE